MNLKDELNQPLEIKKRSVEQAHNELKERNRDITQSEKGGSKVRDIAFKYGAIKPLFVSAEDWQRIFGQKGQDGRKE